MKSCVFCNGGIVPDDILTETENFLVKMGIGLITAGHVMIITKKHYLCLAELPEKLEREFSKLKEQVIKEIKKNFAEPFLVEYGVWGQSVGHAHIHLIPRKAPGYKIESIMEELGKPTGIPFAVGDFALMRKLYQKNGGYALLEEKGIMYLFDIAEVKKDYYPLNYRPFFAKRGIGKGSWKNLSAEEKKEDEKKRKLTKEKLLPSIS